MDVIMADVSRDVGRDVRYFSRDVRYVGRDICDVGCNIPDVGCDVGRRWQWLTWTAA